jgi:hypothetical protein
VAPGHYGSWPGGVTAGGMTGRNDQPWATAGTSERLDSRSQIGRRPSRTSHGRTASAGVSIRASWTPVVRCPYASDAGTRGGRLPDQRVNPQGWGQQHVQAPSGQPLAEEGLTPSPRSQSGRPPQWGPPNPNPLWQRKGFWVVAGSIGVLLLVVGLLSEPDQAATPTAATAATTAPTTSAPPAPTTTAAPPTTVQTATVPRLVGMKTGRPRPSCPAVACTGRSSTGRRADSPPAR